MFWQRPCAKTHQPCLYDKKREMEWKCFVLLDIETWDVLPSRFWGIFSLVFWVHHSTRNPNDEAHFFTSRVYYKKTLVKCNLCKMGPSKTDVWIETQANLKSSVNICKQDVNYPLKAWFIILRRRNLRSCFENTVCKGVGGWMWVKDTQGINTLWLKWLKGKRHRKNGAIKKSLEENWGYFGLDGLPAGDEDERMISRTIAWEQVEWGRREMEDVRRGGKGAGCVT